jgi:hypothetical protein
MTQFPNVLQPDANAIRNGLDGVVAQMQEHDKALRSLQETLSRLQEQQRADVGILSSTRPRGRTLSPRTLSPTLCPSEMNMTMTIGDPLVLTPRSGAMHSRLTSVASSIGPTSSRLPSPSHAAWRHITPAGTPGRPMTPTVTAGTLGCPIAMPGDSSAAPRPPQCLTQSVSGPILPLSPSGMAAMSPEVTVVRTCVTAPASIHPVMAQPTCTSPRQAYLSPRHMMPPSPRQTMPASPRHVVQANHIWLPHEVWLQHARPQLLNPVTQTLQPTESSSPAGFKWTPDLQAESWVPRSTTWCG